MALNSFSQNNNQTGDHPYTAGGYEKAKLRKLLLVVVGVILAIIIVIALRPESQQSKYTKSATAAARKLVPDAKVRDLKVAGNFATAIVNSPSATGQANAGNTTVFKVNKDGSMVQLASGSYFSPLDLLRLGVPLATQAELSGGNIGQVKQSLLSQCGYLNGAVGYTGFNGSFNPGGWQIDADTLSSLEQKLSAAIANQNAAVQSDMKVVCVSATPKSSNDSIDKTTYISTFTLQVQFVTNNGTLTTHTVTFAIGPNHYSNYTLDGHDIK